MVFIRPPEVSSDHSLSLLPTIQCRHFEVFKVLEESIRILDDPTSNPPNISDITVTVTSIKPINSNPLMGIVVGLGNHPGGELYSTQYFHGVVYRASVVNTYGRDSLDLISFLSIPIYGKDYIDFTPYQRGNTS